MDVLIIIFIAMALLIGLMSILLIGREVVIEEKERRQKKVEKAEAPVVSEVKAEEKPQVKAEPEKVEAVETVATEETVITEESGDEDNVAFSAGFKTLDEKYLDLTSEYRGYYDEIVRYAMAVEGSKRYKNASYEEYKVGQSRVVRLKIRRDVIVCELVIPNLAFKNYVSDNKVAVKQAPITIKVVDATSLSAVKDSIEIAVKAIEEEKAYKKEQAKIRRRENRKAAKETADASENA